MIKTLRFLFMSMFVMLGMSDVMADNLTIVFDPAETYGENTQASGADKMEKDGVTIITTSGGLHCAEYRFAKGSTTTFSSSVGNITKIEFTCTASGTTKYGPGCFAAQEGYTYDGLKGKWTGDASDVSFVAESAQVRASQIIVTIGEGSGEIDPQPTEGQTPEAAITIARALEIISGLADGKMTSYTYYVKGRVVAITKKGTTTSFTMSDPDNANDLLTVYNAKGLENKDIADQGFMEDGDDVIVIGVLQKYADKSGNITPEVCQGYVYSVNGKTKADEVIEPTIDGGTTPETAISVKAAVDAIATMVDGQTTKDTFYVAGIVKSITEISIANGNATFVMTDASGSELTVYRVKGLQQKGITDAELLKENDNVVVYAKLQKYVKDGTMTPEMTQGYIYSINGKTEAEEKPITLEGEGTLEKPYTVSDMLQLPSEKDKAEGQEMVWVKGFIVGSLNSSGSAFDAEAVSNLALGATADETDASHCVPIQLPTGNLRTALNVVDNPSNKGKEVLIQGYVLKYMSRTGLKNIADFILDGVRYTTGINAMKAEKANDAIFNLNGQRLMKAQKGLNIIGSKKVMVK